MAEIVNLRTARKAKEREKSRATGDENAAKFGRTKAEKNLEKAPSEELKYRFDRLNNKRLGGIDFIIK